MEGQPCHAKLGKTGLHDSNIENGGCVGRCVF